MPSDNTQINSGSGDTIRDIYRAATSAKTQVVLIDTGGGDSGTETIVSPTVGLSSNLVSSTFTFSALAANSTTSQLAMGASFTGTVEAIPNQVVISILLITDQPWRYTIYEYIDSAGDFTSAGVPVTYTGPGGVNGGLNVAFPANGNYFQGVLQNLGGATTLLNLNVAYGSLLQPKNNLGNLPVSIADVGGVAGGSLNVTTGANSLTTDLPTQAAQTNDGSLSVFLSGNPLGPMAGVDFLEQLTDDASGLNLNVKIANQQKIDVLANGGVVLTDCQGPWLMTSGQVLILDTAGYNTACVSSVAGAVTPLVSNSLSAGTFYAVGSLSIMSAQGTASNAFGSTISSYLPLQFRYLKLTMATATGNSAVVYLRNVISGTYSNVNLQTINGGTAASGGVNYTLGVGGTAAEGAAVATNPIPAAGRSRTAALAAISAGDVITHTMSSGGALVNFPYSVPDVTLSATSGTSALATATATQIFAANASFRNYITGIQVYNSSATVATTVTIVDAAGPTVLWCGYCPAATASVAITPLAIDFPTPLRNIAVNTALQIQCGTTGASVYWNAQGFTAP